jgi:4-nitrophenyl phosphatase
MGYYNKVLSKVSQGELLNALGKIDTFILEPDGVLYAGDKLLENAKESIISLQNLGKTLIYYPNSSTRSRESLKHKLGAFGIEGEISKMFTPSYITAEYLKKYHPEISKVYVVGKEGIKIELQLSGLTIVEGDDIEEHSNESSQILKNFDLNQEIGAVVVSFDESFSFKKVLLSCLLLERKDCLFIATSNSPYLMTEGKKYPGVGPLISAISKVSKRSPDVITCRPNELMIEIMKETLPEIDLKKTCIVGDKIATDLSFAKNSGILSMIVLSGVTLPQELESIIQQDVNYIIHSFGIINQILG